MELRAQERQWERLGRRDPLWAILSHPDKKNGAWDEEEFFATGKAEIAASMARASALGLPMARKSALDFGCGVGRLTQALADYFEEVTGVDIAPTMIEKARLYNRHGERCRYVLNAQNHLGAFPTACFDLVYSNITLQHLPRRHVQSYIGEFVRVLRPKGLLVFQVPDRYRNWCYGLGHRLYLAVTRRVLHRPDVVELYGLPRKHVVALLEGRGMQLLGIEEDPAAGPEWLSWRYLASQRE